VLASGGFTGLALVDGSVIATSIDQVQRFPLDGSPPTTLANTPSPYGLIVVGGNAYFLEESHLPSELYAVPLAGGEPTRVLDAWFEMERATADGDAIYFPSVGGGVTRFAVADRSQTKLALPVSLLIDAIAVVDGAVYVAAQDWSNMSTTAGMILKFPPTGGAPTTLLETDGHPWNLVADRGGLTWVQEAPGFSAAPRVVRAGLDGRDPHTLVDHPARSLVIQGDTLYIMWDGLSQIPLAGGAEITLVPHLSSPGFLAVAGGDAAWVDPIDQAKSSTIVPTLSTACW